MKDLKSLELKPLVFLALADLRPQSLEENMEGSRYQSTTIFFSAKDIHNWMNERGIKYSLGSVRNLLTEIRNNREIKKAKGKKNFPNTFILYKGDKEINRVNAILEINDSHKEIKYSLGRQTVENRLSAKIVLQLGVQCCAIAKPLPIREEMKLTGKIYNEFKNIYNLSSKSSILKLVESAVEGLYFIREDGCLSPTNRFLEDENDFIRLLAESPLSLSISKEDKKDN